MSRVRTAAVAVFSLRVAYGAALIVAPARITRSWLGPAVDGDATQVALRGLGGARGAAARLRDRRGGARQAAAAVAGRSAWPAT